ncbi:hypothetical protein PV328_007042 [Microctonus aethiopoides]|uniref:Uncharacterized protein n=1 Tax=Microctonus aethiopoides TaxID=144406 RepID=A0AA39KU66_9HYME|nr:hypothetical protein PV328_007042 [Microctonus aethiopoides]
MDKMIFNLIFVITIASIINVSNSIPISMKNSDSTNLYEDNLDTLTKPRRYIRLEDSIEDPVNYLQNDAINNSIDDLEHNALTFIDISGDQLKEIIERTNKNIEDAIDPVKDIFKAKIKTARQLATLLFNNTRYLPQFATRVMNKFSPNNQDSIDFNNQ